jgi:hypothetical protein
MSERDASKPPKLKCPKHDVLLRAERRWMTHHKQDGDVECITKNAYEADCYICPKVGCDYELEVFVRNNPNG